MKKIDAVSLGALHTHTHTHTHTGRFIKRINNIKKIKDSNKDLKN